MATTTKKPKPLTDAQEATIHRCLALISDHNDGRENIPEMLAGLAIEGMKLTKPTGTFKVSAAGITVTDTSGHAGAVRTWGNKARRALVRGEV